MAVITGRKRRKRNLIIAAVMAQIISLTVDHIDTAFPVGTINITRLAKPAPANTATKNLRHSAVMHYIDKRYHKVFGEISLIKIRHNTLFDGRGSAVFWRDRRHSAILIVGDIIERGNIYPLDLRRHLQKFLTAPSFPFGDA